MSIQEALSWINQMHYSQMVMDMDSLEVFSVEWCFKPPDFFLFHLPSQRMCNKE